MVYLGGDGIPRLLHRIQGQKHPHPPELLSPLTFLEYIPYY